MTVSLTLQGELVEVYLGLCIMVQVLPRGAPRHYTSHHLLRKKCLLQRHVSCIAFLVDKKRTLRFSISVVDEAVVVV